MPVGGGGRGYCGEKMEVIVNFFGVSGGGAGVWCAAGLGNTSFDGKRSCGKSVVAGKKIFDMQEDLFARVLGGKVGGAKGVFSGEIGSPSAARDMGG